jgi:hypothetical protein
MNATHLLMYQPKEYCKYFKNTAGERLYMDDDHVKVHGHWKALNQLMAKGGQIFFVFEFKTEAPVENYFYEEIYIDGGEEHIIPGFKVIKTKDSQHPQLFAHFELKVKRDKPTVDQPAKLVDFLTGHVDDESDVSVDSDAD